ncbi:MAG: NAD(P)H-binding protein [Nocardioidaceae bacterium]
MRIAVTGATGRLGSQIIGLLAAHRAHDVVAVCRRKPDDPSPGTTVAVADYADPDALCEALRDVDTLVFVSSDGEAQRLLHHHHNVVRAAADAGVGHVVALSSLDADLASPFCYAVTNRQTELMLAASGCAVSFARASLYTEFFGHWLTAARASGEIRVPAGTGRVSLVSRADVGRAMAALATSGPSGGQHELTGPDSLDLEAMAAIVTETFGVPIRYVDLSPAEHLAEMADEGEDAWWIYAYSSMFASVREQRWARTTDEVARLTGRAPTSLGDTLRTWPG